MSSCMRLPPLIYVITLTFKQERTIIFRPLSFEPRKKRYIDFEPMINLFLLRRIMEIPKSSRAAIVHTDFLSSRIIICVLDLNFEA